MLSYGNIYFVVILPTFWHSVTMTMLAKSQGFLSNGFGPQNDSTLDNAESLVDCQLKCDIDPLCMSFFFSNVENKCSIHNVSFVDTTVLNTETGWTYLQSVNDKCPATYIYTKAFGMCYKLYRNSTSKIDYLRFKATCEAEGAEILKIISHAFAEHIKDFMVRQTDGLRYFAINGHWNGSMWVYDDGTPITYFRWGPQRPWGDVSVYKQIYMRARDIFAWNNKIWLNLGYPCGFLCGKQLE